MTGLQAFGTIDFVKSRFGLRGLGRDQKFRGKEEQIAGLGKLDEGGQLEI
jgi:hypothetical protein